MAIGGASTAHSQPTRPTLATLCEGQLASTFSTMASVEASCAEQTCALTARKDALLVELATVSEALEQLSVCARRVREAREDLVDDIADTMGDGAAARLEAQGHGAAAGAVDEGPTDRAMQAARQDTPPSPHAATKPSPPPDETLPPSGASASLAETTLRRQVYIGNIHKGRKVKALL